MISASENYNFTMVSDSKTFATFTIVRCLCALAFFGFGLAIMGTILTVIGYNDPFKDDPVLNQRPNPLKIVGPVFISIGLFLLLLGVIACISASIKGNASVIGAVNGIATIQSPLYMGSNLPYPENIQVQQFPNLRPYPSTSTPYPTHIASPGFHHHITNLPDQFQQKATCEFPQNNLPPTCYTSHPTETASPGNECQQQTTCECAQNDSPPSNSEL